MNGSPASHDIELLSRLLAQRGNLSLALLEGPGFVSAVRMRMSALEITDSAAFAARVASDEREFQILASEIAVPETWLFRYGASYEYLRDSLIALRRTRGGSLSCASLGCATGVEAWCIAACALAAGWPAESLTVHAIDRNPIAIESAQAGRISHGNVRSEFPSWAAPWISLTTDGVELSREVRQCVRVRAGDLFTTNDLLASDCDVIFCRNVLIYLDAPARMLLRDRIAQWLGADGILLLGHADAFPRGEIFESIGPPSAFALRHKKAAAPPPPAPSPPRARVELRAPLSHNQLQRPRTEPAPRERAADELARDHATLMRQVHELVHANQFARARTLTETAVTQSPGCVELLETLGGILSAQNELARAHQVYQRVVYLEPDHGPALLALAELSAALDRPEEAERFRARVKRLIDT